MTPLYRPSTKGFTLMETLLAISVVAILLTTFLAVFGPATSGIRRAVSVEEGNRLATTLEQALGTLNEDEQSDYDTAFDKAFDWISGSSELGNAIILFNYRGDPSQITDGQPEPYTSNNGLPGQDYILTSTVERLGADSTSLEQKMSAVDGRAFVVRMRQLIREDDGSLTPTDSNDGSLISFDGNSASSAEEFEDAVIAFQAEFYVMPASSYQYASQNMARGGSDYERILGQPVLSRNMAVRR